MPNFVVNSQVAPKQRTFTARKDLPNRVDQPIRNSGEVTFKPDADRAIAETRQVVADFGLDEPIDSIIAEADTTLPFVTSDRGAARFQGVAPESLDLQGVKARSEAVQTAQELRGEGIDLDGEDVDELEATLVDFARNGIEGAAKHRRYWQKLSKWAGRKAGDAVATGMETAGLGIALLDVVSMVNKKFKMSPLLMDPAQAALIENEVLPKVTLGGKDYSTGTTAALDIMRRRMWGWGERRAGDIAGIFDDDLAEQLKTGGEAESRAAREQIPALVSALGRPLPWFEVAQRAWNPDDPDMFYQKLSKPQMAALAVGDAVSELLVDPSLFVGGVMGKMPNVTRAGLLRIAPEKTAKVASDIAHKTVKLDDAIDSLAAARAAEKKVNEEAEAAVERIYQETGQRVMPLEHVKKQILARQRTNVERQFVSNMQGGGESDPIKLRRTPRRLPETVSATETIQYVDGVRVVGEGPLLPTNQTKELLAQMNAKLEHLRVMRNTAGPEDQAILTRQIRNTEAQVNEIFEQGGAKSFVLVEPVIKTVKNAKTSRGLADELADTERTELMRDYDVVPEITDEGSLLQQRELLGPDDSEMAGDALNLMTRTGGTGIESIKTTGGTYPEYRTFDAPKVALVDWRKIDQANQTLRTERKLAAEAGQAAEYNVNSSAIRTLARHEDIVRRNMGEARSRGKKNLIQGYERDLEMIKKAQSAIKADPEYNLEKAFDSSWLPKDTKSIMADPGKFNQWLKIAGDRAVRSLYPGSLQLKSFEAWRTSKLFAPFRDPQRFFDAYSPGSWTRIRGGFDAYDSHTAAFRDQFEQLARDAGVITDRSKWDIRKDFHPYGIDKKKDELWFDLLNTKQNSEEFNALAHQASPEMMRAYTKARKVLNYAAEQQGITDTEMMLDDYIRHVFTADQFAQGARPIEYVGLPIDPEVFASHLLPRTGKEGYPRSAMLAFEAYNRGMHRKLILEPVYDDIVQTGGEAARKYNAPVMQTYANDMVEQLKGKPTILSKHIESWTGGKWKANKIDQTLMGITSMIWAGTLPLNPRYPLMQIATGTITTASRFGLFRTAKSIWQMGTPEGQRIAKSIGLDKSHRQFFESDTFRNVNELLSKRGYSLSPFGVLSTAKTEYFSRGVTANAAVDMYLTKFGFATWEEAKDAGYASRIAFEALRASEEVNHMFGVMGRSPWLSRRGTNSGLSSATQFLSFVPKQIEELSAQAMKNPGKIAEYMAFSGYFSRVAAEAAGIDVTNYVGLGFISTNIDQYSSPGVDLMIKYIEMNAAWSSLDPDKAEKATADFVNSARIVLVPGGAGLNAMLRGAERLSTGEQSTLDGNKLRNLDFKEIDFLHNPTPENIGSAFNPSRADPTPSSALPGVGGDFLPSVFGQQPIRDALYTRGNQAIQRENKRFVRELRNISQDIATAYEDGNMERAEELISKFEDTTKVRFQSADPIERALYARNVSQLIRDIEDDPILIDRFLKIAKDFGIDMAP